MNRPLKRRRWVKNVPKGYIPRHVRIALRKNEEKWPDSEDQSQVHPVEGDTPESPELT
jgi:hypothetical protein